MKRLVRVALAAAATVGAHDGYAQTYPTKPVRIVAAYPAGGSVDIVARMVGQRLTETMGRTFLIDNRSGASGNIGTEYVAKSAPDGYTLLMGSAAALASNPAIYPKLAFNPLTDFAPITLIVIQPNVLVVHPTIPARNVSQFIALAKAQPGALNYGSSGVGSSQHMAAELFRYYTKAEITHVPYKGGAPALTDLLGGQIGVMFETIPTAVPHIKAARLRALGVTTRQRTDVFPDLPTISESGLRDYEYRGWIGLVAPASTPPEIVRRLHGEVVKALETDLTPKFKEMAFIISGSGAKDFAQFIRDELALHQKIVNASAIRPE
jgi:tripartite-type tricarboxylate transporter receptor subunit TctC